MPENFASPPLTMAAGESTRQRFATEVLARKWATGPASLPWNGLALELIVKYQQNPLRAVRVLAHVHAAAHDAVVRLATTTSSEAAQAVAVQAASAAVLAHFYPRESPGRIEAIGVGAMLAVAARAGVSPEDLTFARAAGRRAAADAIRRVLDDGAGASWNPADRPAAGPSVWRAAPPLNLYNPTEPLAGKWRTWALADGSEIQPPPPPEFASERYRDEVREVLQVSRALTAEQKRIADDWNLDKGSVTPPGVWNRKAMALVAQHGLDTAQAARVLAALNVAMSDALVACWQAKFAHWTVRPVTVIREQLDADFLPYLFTPPFPSYVSGHAAASGAAAEVLAAFFPEDAGELRASADEAALSRLYGGIHLRSDNEEGLRLGRAVGRRVLERSRRTDGAPASGTPSGAQ
ncbi:vanadium-dependent haloperoxidase [Candidatus Accumulibacter aalborgensis]|nr:vanadium-dependent haloperoxidase [Candidatus Accumulibacter aalborgensis]